AFEVCHGNADGGIINNSLPSRFAQLPRLIRKMALCYILDGAEVFQSAVFVPAAVRDHVNMFDRTIRHEKTVPVIEVQDPTAPGSLSYARNHRLVFRMVARCDQFKCYRSTRFKFVNAIELLRPGENPGRKIPGKSSSLTGAFALGKKLFAAPQLLFS